MIGNLIVGTISTILSVGMSYFLWGRTTTKLNKLLIEEKENKKKNIKKAELVGYIKKSSEDNIDLSYFYLEIYNKGRNKARNIRFEKLTDEEVDFGNVDKFPLDLEPNQTTKVNISTYSDSINKIKIKLIWNDDFSRNRQKQLSIPIL